VVRVYSDGIDAVFVAENGGLEDDVDIRLGDFDVRTDGIDG
jgi:hypothetical protein